MGATPLLSDLLCLMYVQKRFMQVCWFSSSSLGVTENGVLKLLTSINPNKAAGPDNIKPKLLKELATEIAPILTIIFRKSFDTGEVPLDWRNANVNPL
jgi:hypothetical protein